MRLVHLMMYPLFVMNQSHYVILQINPQFIVLLVMINHVYGIKQAMDVRMEMMISVIIIHWIIQIQVYLVCDRLNGYIDLISPMLNRRRTDHFIWIHDSII